MCDSINIYFFFVTGSERPLKAQLKVSKVKSTVVALGSSKKVLLVGLK